MSDYLRIQHYNYRITSDIDQIIGKNGKTYPMLAVPIFINFTGSNEREFQPFIITGIESGLSISEMGKLSTSLKLSDRKISSPHEVGLVIDFPMTPNTLAKFVQNRPIKKDLECRIELNLQISMLSSFQTQDGNAISFVTSYEIGNGELRIKIPYSTWNEKIQPQLGIMGFKSMFIPDVNGLIPEEYEGILNELTQSQEYIQNGDYDKAVAHCRSALEPIRENIKSWKELFSSGTELKWISKLSESTLNWLDTIQKETYGLTNKAHHYPSIGHFSKFKAEIIYTITLSIVAYAGYLGTDNE
ncbi:MAG: hypothetical protein RJQ09_11300 [Cyclobacteriaceae bacterium]